MSRYRLGVEAEREARKLLEGMGYLVIRSAASKGPFDLIGFRHDGVLCVQVKRVGSKFTKTDQQGMKEAIGRLPPCAKAQLWTRHPGRRWETAEWGLGLMGRALERLATHKPELPAPQTATNDGESDGSSRSDA